MLFYHAPGRQNGLIPDTEKARKWAVDKRGATRLNSLTFHYFDSDGVGSEYRVGDFYCVIRHRGDAYLGRGLVEQAFTVDTADVALRGQTLISDIFRVEKPNCKCIYLSPLTFGVSIPSSAFGMEEGAFFLGQLYNETAARLSAFGSGYGLEVSYWPTVDVENIRQPSGLFSVPFLFNEITKLHAPLEQLAASPRVAPDVDLDWKIEPVILTDMTREAVHQWRRFCRRKKAWWLQRPEPAYVANLERASFCVPLHAMAAQKCAFKLVKWIVSNNLVEFGQRDAVRAVRQPLHGRTGDGGGVADALRILIGAHYIQACPLPSIEYLCKRPSPWFRVNPLLYSSRWSEP